MSMSNYLENAILNHISKNTVYAQPANLYVALYTSDPTDTGVAGAEVAAGNYARQLISFNAAADGAISNSADVLFPIATVAYGTVTHFAVLDALIDGNMLYSGELQAQKSIDINDQFVIQAGHLTLSLD